jgi:hypothetical protein
MTRPHYPAWPWEVEELTNTAWRNAQSGKLLYVRLPTVYRGKPILDPNMVIGFWAEGRLLVEDWARVDHLPLGTQLQWYGAEIAYWRLQMLWWNKETKGWLASPPLEDPSLAHLKAGHLKAWRAEREMNRAARQAQAFAACYGLAGLPEVLNTGVQLVQPAVQTSFLLVCHPI